ncbi:MAG: sensor histidine kinase [Campylobacteraceae bacterium]|nr:sensor histidine kinase [Campylobacteraceae bacterium]
MKQFFSNYSFATLILVPINLMIIIFIFVYASIHKYSVNIVHQNILEYSAKQTINQLIPPIEKHIDDYNSLMIYLRKIIQSDSGVFYIGLTTQEKSYAHVSASIDFFREDPFYFQETLPNYPEIKLEIIINAKPMRSFLENSKKMKFFGIALSLSILIINTFLILFLVSPLRKLANSLHEKTKFLNHSLSQPPINEILSISNSFKALSSSQKKQKQSLEKLNLHLEKIIEAKTSSLKAEIEEKTEAKLKLELTNEEKTILLKEVHHRVKNNLAIIVGLIRMQSRQTTDLKTKSMFKDLQNRVKTMELIHTNLYASTQFSKIDMKDYLASLVGHLGSTFSKDGEEVTFSVHCDDIMMSVDKAIVCGQITNELVTNAFKHAFKDSSEGHVWIQISNLGDNYELLVEDNGTFVAQENDSSNIPEKFSLGLSLVHELTRYQLKGTVDIVNQGGLKYRIVFKK